LYEILIGSPVFGEHEDPDDVIAKKLSGYVPELGSEVPPVLDATIQACLASDPRIRPSFDDILKLFQEFDFDILPRTDVDTVRRYVWAVTDWELSPH
jgi:hypothetical protein